MGWPPWMALELPQQLAYRAIIRDWIAYRLDGLEPEAAVHVAGHNAPLAWRLSGGILHVIVARGVRLPDVDLDAFNWPI